MFRVHRDFKGLLKAAQDEYDSLVELNESLRKKVAEWNKDEEIRKAVELAEYNRTHSLCQISDNEKKAERAFRDSHYKSCKNGSKYLYELTGTGIGTAITIKCPVCGEEKTLLITIAGEVMDMIFRAILFALATAAVIGGLAYWLKCLCLCDYENACDYSQCDSCPFPCERHNCG